MEVLVRGAWHHPQLLGLRCRAEQGPGLREGGVSVAFTRQEEERRRDGPDATDRRDGLRRDAETGFELPEQQGSQQTTRLAQPNRESVRNGFLDGGVDGLQHEGRDGQ